MAVTFKDGERGVRGVMKNIIKKVPRKLILTPKGEKKIAEAEEDLRHDRLKKFETAKELIGELEEK